MSESLAQSPPILKRGDRFLYSYLYHVLGDENLHALTDSTLEVIGELDEESLAAFTAFLALHNLPTSDNYRGNVRQQRANGYYEVEFDVDNSRLYIMQVSRMNKRDNRVPSYIVDGNH